MCRNLCVVAGLLALVLNGCSSPPPPPPVKKTPTTTDQPTAKTNTPTPDTPKPADPNKPADPAKPGDAKTEAPKPADPAKPGDAKTETPKPADPTAKVEPPVEAPKAASSKDAPLGKATGFENENASGRTIRAWITTLDSSDKAQLEEALNVLEMVGKRAGMAIPKIEALTKHADPTIAEAARKALEAVKTKD